MRRLIIALVAVAGTLFLAAPAQAGVEPVCAVGEVSVTITPEGGEPTTYAFCALPA